MGRRGEKWGGFSYPRALTLPTSAVLGFKGRYSHSIDSKGRMPVPAKLRRSLRPEANETFVATRGFEQCVFLYPANVWEQMETEFSGLNTYQQETREFIRTIYMWADDVALDGQGRISIAKPLMEFADLAPGGKATVIGMLDHIEVWNPEVFDAHIAESRLDYKETAARVMSGPPIRSRLN